MSQIFKIFSKNVEEKFYVDDGIVEFKDNTFASSSAGSLAKKDVWAKAIFLVCLIIASLIV